MMTDNKALAGRFHRDIFENGDLAAADALCSPDFVWRAPNLSAQMPPGPEGVKWFATAIRAGFSNIRITRDDTIAEGDRVVDRWTFHATHTGEFMGVPATGK